MGGPPRAYAARLGLAHLATRPLVWVGLLTVLAWPIANIPTLASLDESWQIALHLAAQLRLRHGVDIIFTYGPLGFLGFPHPYVGLTSAIALIASIAIYVALIGTMLVEARRVLPLWAAIVVTFLAARIFVYLPPFEAFQVLFLVWCVEALADRIRLPVLAMAVIGGGLAGAATLGKVNIGIFAVLMGAVTIAAISRPWWRGLVVFLATTAASGIVLFLALGGHPTDLVAYASGVYQIISGYNEALGGDVGPKRTWIFLALPVVAAILAWIGWRSSRDWPRRRRIGLALLGLVFGFAMWKTALVREHATFVLSTSVVALFAFTPHVERRTWLLAVLAVGIAFTGSSTIQPQIYLDVVGSTRSLYHEVKDSFVPGQVDVAAARTRDQLRKQYRVEPETLAAIGDRTVHIDPHLTSVAYAYPELHWEPLPIFQSYSAYTPELDRLNADLLSSPAGPQRILRSFRVANHTDLLRLWIGRFPRAGEVFASTVDGHFRWFESPEATLETFCRYAETSATDRWQVLARTGGSCAAPEPLATISARAGEMVSVPVETRPDRFVIVRIHGLEPSLLGRVRTALIKGPDWYVLLGDTRYRLIPATAGDGLLLAVPPAADGSGPFAFGAPIRTMIVKKGQSGHDSLAPLTFEFQSVLLRRP
ncbi:MAG: hypothetical protein ABI562_00050 [Chloroflexota bacterium]